jgi:uncharacterized lipoprotein YajG
MKKFLIATLALSSVMLAGCQNEPAAQNPTNTKPQQSQQSSTPPVSITATGSKTGTQEIQNTHLKVSSEKIEPMTEDPIEVDLSQIYDAKAPQGTAETQAVKPK